MIVEDSAGVFQDYDSNKDTLGKGEVLVKTLDCKLWKLRRALTMQRPATSIQGLAVQVQYEMIKKCFVSYKFKAKVRVYYQGGFVAEW